MNDRYLGAMRDEPALQEILENSLFLSMAGYRHHADVSCLEHTLAVADLVFRTAGRWGLDTCSATRGALLHDFYLYDWHTDSPGFHGVKHSHIALKNAGRYFRLNAIEKNAILRHMWPLTPIPPHYPESLLVSMADKTVSFREYKRTVVTGRWCSAARRWAGLR
ncbi:HD family phosphohydrolase [bacterium]|nr:HD family phosphohydrolase [bacterium]